MKKVTSITLSLILLGFTHPSPVSATIHRVAITQDKTIFDISQQLSVQIIDVLPGRSFVFVEYIALSEDDFSIKIRPADIIAHYQLIDRDPRHLEMHLGAVDQAGAEAQVLKLSSTTEASIYSLQGTDLSFYRAESKKISARISKDQSVASFPDGTLQLTFDPTAIQADFTLALSKNINLPLPTNMRLLSPLYQFDIRDKSALNVEIPISIQMQYTDSGRESKSIYFFDKSNASWVKLPSYNDVEEKTVSAPIHLTYAPLAIFSDASSADGIASWYGFKNCLCAASREYPRGTQLRVTRLKSGASVVVTVNDYGPEQWTGRIIDLDKRAFRTIGSLGSGLIYVNVRQEK